MNKHHHILNAASNLLGISLVIIAGLKVSGHAGKTFADEVTCLAALLFSASCLLSYAAIRSQAQSEIKAERYELWADRVFLFGLLSVTAAVALFLFEAG